MKRAAALGLAALALSAAGSAGAQGAAERQTRHALVIGIGEYADAEIPPLHGIVHDIESARRMAGAMGVPAANVTVLRDRAATAERIRTEIDALNARVQDGDRVFVYYSGHGTRWYDERLKNDGCTEGLMASDGQVLSNVEIGRRLAPLAQRVDKMLVFYDACFSGGGGRRAAAHTQLHVGRRADHAQVHPRRCARALRPAEQLPHTQPDRNAAAGAGHRLGAAGGAERRARGCQPA